MSNLTPTSQSFVDQHGTAEFAVKLPWLDQLRSAGISDFSAKGLPTPRNEAWKFTNLNVLEKIEPASPASTIDFDLQDLTWLPEDMASHRLVFVNGCFQSAHSDIADLPTGVKILSLAAAFEEEAELLEKHLGKITPAETTPVMSLNTAFIDDGFVVVVEKATLDKPIEVVFVNQNASAHHPRNLIVLKDNARATLLERHVGFGAGSYLANHGCEVLVESGSHFKHYRLLEDGAEGINLSNTIARVGKDATYDSFIFSLSGRLSRSEIHVLCEESGAHTNLNGVYVGRDNQHVDHTTLIDHLVPHTTSQETYKGALDDKSRGVFQGAIVVAEGADGTDGRMSNRTLLLSDEAEIDAKPQLEIYADDVQCAHGFTAGELDDESLFYLRSRGIPEAIARSMLVEGFLSEVVDEGVDDAYQDIFKSRIASWMEQ